MKQKDLSDKYYRGETSLEEEMELKTKFADSEVDSAEKDMFAYFQNESKIPGNLEEMVYLGLSEKINKPRKLKIIFISISSAAAVFFIFLNIYFNFQAEKKAEMETDFLALEKALFQVSESIQPEEQQEMMVLWVDNDVEIIIN